MFCDHTTLNLKAGEGGAGAISFRREKYVAKGGPNGGDGGNGGSIFFKVNTALNTLTHLDTYKKFASDKGEQGMKQDKHGKNADDLYLEVPLGTIIREVIRNKNDKIVEKREVADLSSVDKILLIAKGGRGGYGNAHFVSSIRQAPKFAELGEEGEGIEVELELKLVADIGIIGIPSCGKSTLISVISRAKPKIAAYHFTTLVPHLGVVKITERDTYVVADIPGLIEKAHKGKGLGIQFLKHIQRCRLLVHLVDPIQPDLSSKASKTNGPINNFRVINKELEKFSKDLAEKKQIVIINKSDVVSEEELNKLTEKLKKECKGNKRFKLYPESISAATTKGTEELKNYLHRELGALKNSALKKSKTPIKEEHIIYRPHLDNPKYFFVEKIKKGHFKVNGRRIEQIVNMTDFNNREARNRVFDVLNKMGISKELRKIGIKDGDNLNIGKQEFEFYFE